VSYTAEERETGIVWTDADNKIMISTNQRKMITALLKNPAFEEIREDRETEGGSVISINGYLPLGSITIRSKAKGSIRRKSTGTGRRGRPEGIKTCGEVTGITGASGTLCGGIARRDPSNPDKHLSCAKHKNHPLVK